MTTNYPDPSTPPTNTELVSPMKRPFLVTLFAVLVLMITCINLIRFIEALRLWDFLESLPGVSPPYIALTGLFWAVLGFPLTWGLWRGYPQAPLAARILVLAYAAYYWLDRLFVAHTVNASSNWLFAAVTTLIMILLVYWILSRSADYFRNSRS